MSFIEQFFFYYYRLGINYIFELFIYLKLRYISCVYIIVSYSKMGQINFLLCYQYFVGSVLYGVFSVFFDVILQMWVLLYRVLYYIVY